MGECKVCEALEESVDLLQDDLSRLRQTIKSLRTVNHNLRRQLTIAHNNDEEFKALCAAPTQYHDFADIT